MLQVRKGQSVLNVSRSLSAEGHSVHCVTVLMDKLTTNVRRIVDGDPRRTNHVTISRDAQTT